MTSNLLKATLKLLAETSRDTWPKLADEIGVTYPWLCQLSEGKIKEPGVNKTERLYNSLSGKAVSL